MSIWIQSGAQVLLYTSMLEFTVLSMQFNSIQFTNSFSSSEHQGLSWTYQTASKIHVFNKSLRSFCAPCSKEASFRNDSHTDKFDTVWCTVWPEKLKMAISSPLGSHKRMMSTNQSFHRLKDLLFIACNVNAQQSNP